MRIPYSTDQILAGRYDKRRWGSVFALCVGAGILLSPTVAGSHNLSLAHVAAPIPDTACELHVWPAHGMTAVRQRASESMNSSSVLTGIIKRTQAAAAVKGDARAAGVLAAADSKQPPLSIRRQTTVIEHLPLNVLLGVPEYHTVVHDVSLESRTIRRTRTRYDAAPAALCYADLVVDDVVYSREYTRGRKLKSFIRFRDFGSSDRPLRTFATLVEAKLDVFSLDPPVMTDAAVDDLLDAFKTDLTIFSALAAKQPVRSRPQTITGE